MPGWAQGSWGWEFEALSPSFTYYSSSLLLVMVFGSKKHKTFHRL